MRLVNILALELKIWPEGVEKLTQSFAGMVFYQDSAQQIVPLGRMEISDDFREKYVTRAEWQAAVDAIYADEPAELKWPDGATHKFSEPTTSPWRDLSGETWKWLDGEVWKDSKCSSELFIRRRGDRLTAKVVEWEQGDIPNAGDQCEAYVLAETEKQGRPMNRWASGKFIGKALADNGGIALLVECDDGWTHVINAFSYVRPVRTPEQVAAEERESGIQAIQDAYTYTVGLSTHKILHSQAIRLYDAGCRMQVAP